MYKINSKKYIFIYYIFGWGITNNEKNINKKLNRSFNYENIYFLYGENYLDAIIANYNIKYIVISLYILYINQNLYRVKKLQFSENQ
jgi:hypothetical protein